MGQHLRLHTYSRSQRRLLDDLVRLQDARYRLELQQPGDPIAPAPQGPVSLSACIAPSVLALHASSRRALADLSHLLSRLRTFSEEEALMAMKEGTLTELDALCDAGLLEPSERNRYQLHPVIADYARCQLAQPVS